MKQIAGKTIAGIVTRKGAGARLRVQFFLIFIDNTHLEFYGHLGWSTHLENGDIETVKKYAHWLAGRVVVIN